MAAAIAFAKEIQDIRPEPQTVREIIEWSKDNPARWFIDEFLLEHGVHIIHGAEESFKTMVMLQIHEVLTLGGQFLLHEVEGGLRTGMAELEMKMPSCGTRFQNFWKDREVPEIYVLPDTERRKVLTGKSAFDRIGVISDWAAKNELDFVSIDSLAKLFPPGHDTARQDLASDVFSQIQTLPTTLILAHDRKPSHDAKNGLATGNAEIVGSGRMAQEPDIVYQVVRQDKRSPLVKFDCGKMREGVKPIPLELYFDRVDFRLHPVHPLLHLLPASEPQLIEEAEKRYGWKERHTRSFIKTLKELPGIETNQGAPNRAKLIRSSLGLAELRAALVERAEAEEPTGADPSTSP